MSQLINVSVDLADQQTVDREIKGLLEGMEYPGLSHALLLTKDRDDLMEINKKRLKSYHFGSG